MKSETVNLFSEFWEKKGLFGVHAEFISILHVNLSQIWSYKFPFTFQTTVDLLFHLNYRRR
jgi:hypothetical protein